MEREAVYVRDGEMVERCDKHAAYALVGCYFGEVNEST